MLPERPEKEPMKFCSVWGETTFILAEFLRNRRFDGLIAPVGGCGWFRAERRGDRLEQLRWRSAATG